MEYFTLNSQEPRQEAALIRAWNACAGIACPKCGVPAGQYCRDWTRGSWWITRFHKPRQVAAGATTILAKVGIRKLNWAKQKNVFAWDDRKMPRLAERS